MEQPSYKDLERSGMSPRKTIASEGKGLKSYTKDHYASRLKRNEAVYRATKKR